MAGTPDELRDELTLSPVPARVVVEGETLERLLLELTRRPGHPPYRLSISTQDGIGKFKINEGMWTPPYRNEA